MGLGFPEKHGPAEPNESRIPGHFVLVHKWLDPHEQRRVKYNLAPPEWTCNIYFFKKRLISAGLLRSES